VLKLLQELQLLAPQDLLIGLASPAVASYTAVLLAER
jgi:hypothetical protein